MGFSVPSGIPYASSAIYGTLQEKMEPRKRRVDKKDLRSFEKPREILYQKEKKREREMERMLIVRFFQLVCLGPV